MAAIFCAYFRSSKDHRYTLDQVKCKSETEVWSLGQMYDLLIEETHYYLDQVEKCASANDEVQ